MVSSISNGWLIRKILSYKVNGFISKSDGIDQITACLSAIANKEVFVSASIESLLSTSSAQDVFAKLSRIGEICLLNPAPILLPTW
jgi:DNA-binding NarL/FixJ family response regulator